VNVLDVERLAHMRAARVQQLRNLLLVSHAIELRLHRVRRGRHLTKRESRREDFYEDGFHGDGRVQSACDYYARTGSCRQFERARNLVERCLLRFAYTHAADAKKSAFLRCLGNVLADLFPWTTGFGDSFDRRRLSRCSTETDGLVGTVIRFHRIPVPSSVTSIAVKTWVPSG